MQSRIVKLIFLKHFMLNKLMSHFQIPTLPLDKKIKLKKC